MDGEAPLRRAPFGNSPQVGERGSNTHRRILDAALEVFGEHGYHDTQVEHIAEAAGCSRPAFYQYFAGKEDVFWHLAGQLGRSMAEVAEGLEPIADDADGVEQLRDFFDTLIDLYVQYRSVFTAFQAAVRDQRPINKGAYRISDRLGRALLDRVAGARSRLEVSSLGTATVTTFLRAIHYWHLGLGQLPRERFVDGIAQTIHRLLHGRIDGVNAGPLVELPSGAPLGFPVPPPEPSEAPRRARGVRTRAALLAAGAAVLPQRGYRDTRIDDIAERAGVSHGAFYRYFKNKDELFHVLARDAALHMVEMVTTFPEHAEPAELRAWLEHYFAAYRVNGGVISVWQEINYQDPELAAFALDVALAVFDRLTQIVRVRGFGDATVDAIVLLAVVERVPHSVLVLEYLREEVAIDVAAFIIRRALLGLD
jgi:AcrR family transcriptional regulator